MQSEWFAEVPEDAEPILRLLVHIGNNSDGIVRVDFQPVVKWHAPLAVALRDRRLTMLFDRHDGINHVKTRLVLRDLPIAGLEQVIAHLDELWELGPPARPW